MRSVGRPPAKWTDAQKAHTGVIWHLKKSERPLRRDIGEVYALLIHAEEEKEGLQIYLRLLLSTSNFKANHLLYLFVSCGTLTANTPGT